MLSTRSPLKSKNENSVSATLGSMSLGNKENTVSRYSYDKHAYQKLFSSLLPAPCSIRGREMILLKQSERFTPKYLLLNNIYYDSFLQPPSLNSTRVLASKTARKIFGDSEVSKPKPVNFT